MHPASPRWSERFDWFAAAPHKSGGGDSKTTTKVQFSPEQRRLIDLTQPIFEQFAQTPPQLFPQSGIAPFTPLQQEPAAVELPRRDRFVVSRRQRVHREG